MEHRNCLVVVRYAVVRPEADTASDSVLPTLLLSLAVTYGCKEFRLPVWWLPVTTGYLCGGYLLPPVTYVMAAGINRLCEW